MRGFSAEVTPVILTLDEEANIGRTLAQLTWAREVVVVDSGSTDRTLEICRSFPNVRVVHRAFDDLASQWTFAVGQAQTEWVLGLDADYFVKPEFVDEIDALAPPPDAGAYVAPFIYAMDGRPLRASLYPPREVLLRRGHHEFVMDGHTQRVHVSAKTLHVRTPIIHDDRKPLSRFIRRQRAYMRLEAEKIRAGKHLNLAGRIRRLRVVAPFAVLVYTLFGKGMFLEGRAGLQYTFERVLAECILSIELFRHPAQALA